MVTCKLGETNTHNKNKEIRDGYAPIKITFNGMNMFILRDLISKGTMIMFRD